MSDFSDSAKCPDCGRRFCPDDGGCCEIHECTVCGKSALEEPDYFCDECGRCFDCCACPPDEGEEP